MDLSIRDFLHTTCDNSHFLQLTIEDLYAFSRSESLTLDLQCIMTSFILIKIKVIWGRVGEFPWYKPHPHAWFFKYSCEIKGKIQVYYDNCISLQKKKRKSNKQQVWLQLLPLCKLHLYKRINWVSHRDLKIRLHSVTWQPFYNVFNHV